MTSTIRAILAHGSTAVTVITFVAGVTLFVGKPLAEDFVEGVVDESVETRLNTLERSLRSLEANDAARAGQLAVQNEQLRNIDENQREQRGDIKLILRALTRGQ